VESPFSPGLARKAQLDPPVRPGQKDPLVNQTKGQLTKPKKRSRRQMTLIGVFKTWNFSNQQKKAKLEI
jgi:hypothetical protein